MNTLCVTNSSHVPITQRHVHIVLVFFLMPTLAYKIMIRKINYVSISLLDLTKVLKNPHLVFCHWPCPVCPRQIHRSCSRNIYRNHCYFYRNHPTSSFYPMDPSSQTCPKGYFSSYQSPRNLSCFQGSPVDCSCCFQNPTGLSYLF